MLPDTDHPPSGSPEATEISGISEPCGLDLGFPSFRQLVAPDRKPPTVPKVAINKYGNSAIPKHEVRTSRKITRMGFPGKTGPGKQAGKAKLWACAFPLDAGHNTTARLSRHYVPAMTPRRLRRPAEGVLTRVFVSHHFCCRLPP